MDQNTVHTATIRYPGYVLVAFTHAFTLMLRRSRLILAATIAFLPVLVPLALVFLARVEVPVDGGEAFVRIMEHLYLRVLAPVLALFFATMLIGDDVEGQTIAYILTRPVPRSAWVLGRFLAYWVLSTALLAISAALVFAASTVLPLFTPDPVRFLLFGHYMGLAALATLAYGGLCLFLGAHSKRPIIYGVVLIFGWQRLAMLIPGLVDFLTITKYLETLYPTLAELRARDAAAQQGILGFEKVAVTVGGVTAGTVLVLATLLFIAATALTVRRREYPTTTATGG